MLKASETQKSFFPFLYPLTEDITVSTQKYMQFVGIMTVLTDIICFSIARLGGIKAEFAYILSFGFALLVHFGMFLKIFDRGITKNIAFLRFLRGVGIVLLTFGFRYAMLSYCLYEWHLSPQVAIVPTSIATALVLYFGNLFFVLWSEKNQKNQKNFFLRWEVATLGILIYLCLLRFLYMGVLELEYHEAYYWTYSQKLDIGYLDHPPMVAWLNYLSTFIFGNTEWGVRFPTIPCYVLMNVFLFLLTKDIFDRSTACRALILLNVLRPFFETGFLMTTDVPLMTCWAGTIYFLHQVFLRDKRWGWWGVGIFLGLGLVSKYTIALLGFAILVFMVMDKKARRWFFRPEPYAAFFVTIFIFLPVILWNMQNDWISFKFQSGSRLSVFYGFNLDELFNIWLKMLTPVGIFAIILALLPRSSQDISSVSSPSYYRFLLVFTLFPLSIFIYQSCIGNPKANWTSPIWFPLIPLLAHQMSPEKLVYLGKKVKFVLKLWVPTIILMMSFYGIHWCYYVFGIPGVGYPIRSKHTQRWQEIGEEIRKVEQQLIAETGTIPLVVGMDEFEVSALLGFYRDQYESEWPKKTVINTSGRHLFGQETVMYSYWFPSKEQKGKNIILVGEEYEDLNQEHLQKHFLKMGPIQDIFIVQGGKRLRQYCYQIGYEYRE